MQSWHEKQADLQRLAEARLFFIGGAPRSGTTWLQQLLDSHPEISCSGEGLFMKHLAEPLSTAMAEYRAAVQNKNDTVFRGFGGFVPPDSDGTEHLVATGILLALDRQCGGKRYLAVGEKTPENVFFFPRLRGLFPAAKFIGIAREQRDVLSSAWHFFQRSVPGQSETDAKFAFIRSALPSMNAGARAMLAIEEQYGADCCIVTYEEMLRDTAQVAGRLFGFLGVDKSDNLVAQCVSATSFGTLAGRSAGTIRNGSFYRAGVVGNWQQTLTSEMSDAILNELAWMYPRFEWNS